MGLFLTTDDFKASAPDITRSYDFERDLEPKINQIVEIRILDYISEAEYNNLDLAYNADNLSADQETLLKSLKPAIAYFVYLHLLTVNRVNVSTMGTMESRSEDGTSSAASFHAIADVKEEIGDLAYSFLNKSLKYLEAKKAVFPDWAASESYTKLNSTFVNTAELFTEHGTYSLNLYSFLTLKPYLQRVHRQIEVKVGETLTADLLSKMLAGTLSAAEKKAVKYLQAWQAPEALILSLPYFRVKPLGNSLLLKSSLDGPEGLRVAPDNVIRHIENDLRTLAESAKTKALKYFTENTTDFPDFPLSDHELDDGDPSYKFPDNSNKKSFRV